MTLCTSSLRCSCLLSWLKVFEASSLNKKVLLEIGKIAPPPPPGNIRVISIRNVSKINAGLDVVFKDLYSDKIRICNAVFV